MRNKSALYKIIAYLFLFLVAVFSIFPFYIMFKSSLETSSEILGAPFSFLPKSGLNFDNYIQIFERYPILKWVLNSFFVSAMVIVGNLIFSVAAAYALARIKFKGKNLLFLIIVSMLIIPIQVLIVPLYLITTQLGWNDNLIAIIAPNLVSPFAIFLLRQAFIAIPKELDEAAIMDGCSRLGVLIRIIIPNSIPTIATVIVIKFMWTWGDFMWPSLVLTSEKLKTLPVGIATFATSPSLTIWNLVMAASVIGAIPIMVLFFMLQKYFVKGLTEGSVKG